jgi:hypothetical protein
MDNQSINPYERLDVVVVGNRLTARPIDFLYEDGKPVAATKYETTCPNCGSMLQFSVEEVIGVGSDNYVGCHTCGEGFVENNTQEKPIVEDKIVIIQNMEFKKKDQPPVDRGCPFIDPVEAGFEPSKV